MPFPRLSTLLALVLLSAACAAQPPVPPSGQPPAPPTGITPPWRLPFMVDAAGLFRSDFDTSGWYGAEVHLRVGVDRVFGPMWNFNQKLLAPHQLTFDAGWERGFGVSPNPMRAWFTSGYSFAVDYFGDEPGEWKVSLSRHGGFPLQRSTLFSVGTGLALGLHYGEGTQFANTEGGLDHRAALRLQHWAFIGVGVVEFRLDGALNLNFDPGVFAEPEFSAGLRLGRPLSPVFVYIGWTWFAFENGGGSWFTVKLGIAL